MTQTTQLSRDAEALIARKSLRLGRLNSLMENGFWDWELGIDVQWYSTRLASLLDYSLEGDFPNELLRLLAQTTEVSAASAQKIRWCLAQNQHFDERLEISDPEGQRLWLRLRGAASVHDTWGPYCAGSLEDISDRVLLETERGRFAAELERSNSELESFADVASHDLKAPLRHIGELAKWLQNSEAGLSPAEQLEQLQRCASDIGGRVDLMDQLLSGLLDYARVGRAQDRIELVDVRVVLEEVLTLLAPPGEMVIELECTAAPLTTNPVELQQCIRNLLDNAIKHADKRNPCVRVEALDDSLNLAIRVHDNGSGIPDQQRTGVFEMFRTLEQGDDTKGSGMGLAIVKKSVLANDGSVTIKESPLGGVCVELLWPRPAV